MLTSFDTTPRSERICVALDCSADEAIEIAEELAGQAAWMKVGMTLYYAQGPSIVRQLKSMGYKVFLDLKLHDIPHQVRGAAAAATQAGADMITVHTVGGAAMMQAAVEGSAKAAESMGTQAPVILGITVLTSFDQESLQSIGVERSINEQVLQLAALAHKAGLHGVVASPREAEALRAQLGEDAYIVTPGVRPQGADTGDQSRVATPAEAFDNGASHLVIGRPITQADDRVAAWFQIAREL